MEIVLATQELVSSLFGRLRKSDRQEVWASSNKDVDDALQKSFEASTKCWNIVHGGRAIAAFGVAPNTMASHIGSPWLLGTEEIKDVRISFLEASIEYTRYMIEDFEVLMNYVDARNTLSIRWLGWLGYTIEKPEPYGPEGMPFHLFWMRKDSCAYR